jgi:hypothetical protein
MVRLLGGLVLTVWTLDAAPRPRCGQGRGVAGTGRDPELAAYRISDGCRPNVQGEVGRLVGLLPIATARTELAGRGRNLDEKAVRRIASELGTQMLAVRTRGLAPFRAGTFPAGTECAGKRIAVPIDGGRVRIRTIVKTSRVGGQRRRRKFRIAWRAPKVLIIYALDERGRMVRGSRPVIDGTLQGPGAWIERVAFHLHRLGAAQAREVVFVADGAPWIGTRLDWVVAQVGLNPLRVVEVLDWCHGVHHVRVAVALEALPRDKATRPAHDQRLRTLLKQGKSRALLEDLEALADGPPADSAVWRELRYLSQHAEARRLRYAVFRSWRLPMGSGAIESTLRRVVNLRLKGNSLYWTEANAEAVLQLRAAVVSGRWDEVVAHTQEALVRDRRKAWRWTPPDCLAELRALEAEDDEMPQASTAKRAKHTAA